MTTPQIRKKIDEMIAHLDKFEATPTSIMNETGASNMKEAKQEIARGEMNSLGIGDEAYITAKAGGRISVGENVPPHEVYRDHTSRHSIFEELSNYI